MTVHNFLLGLQLGQTVKIPSNCTFGDLKDYAATRFGYYLQRVGESSMKRVCPTCGR